MAITYKKISQFKEEILSDLITQCNDVVWIRQSLLMAWSSFEKDGWRYDGATFVREKNDRYFEASAFIHDWLNHTGYVGKAADLYFIKIMIALEYGENIIFERCKWMQWTFLNVAWHWLRFKNPKNDIPNELKLLKK